ncbi:MAG: MoaD/ThiS family protein [bacterium]|nr:hypothetical protein [Deltaproteobacteria bacterium]MCP4904880.1 MoaD/ThiS family protein [bacterium]
MDLSWVLVRTGSARRVLVRPPGLLYTFSMRISFYATLRKIVGEKHIELPLPEPTSLAEVLEAVVLAHPDLGAEMLDESGELDRGIHLFVDGRSSRFLSGEMATVVDGSQSIEFFPAVAGG